MRADDVGRVFIEVPEEELAEMNSVIAEYEQFIRNGVELGYIQVPENADDKACETVKKVLM